MSRLEAGDILRVTDVTRKGRVTAIDERGRKRQLDARYGEENRPKFPDGTIESLYPVMQRVLAKYPGVRCPEPGFWIEIEAAAPFSPEEAVKKLRMDEKSSKELGEAVTLGVLAWAGMNPRDIGEQAMDVMKSQVTHEIKAIYVATTESRP